MCRPGMSPKDKTYKSIRNQNKIRLEGDVNSCSLESSFNQEPIGQWQLQGLKQEPGGQRLSRPLRASHFHPLTLSMCNGCQQLLPIQIPSAIKLKTYCKWWVSRQKHEDKMRHLPFRRANMVCTTPQAQTIQCCNAVNRGNDDM